MMLPLVALFTCSAATADEKPTPKNPNIILILADDIGLPGFGCTGGIYKTPNIDALAKGGTLYDTCFAAPLCAPSRAMLMTGRYAFRTGVTSLSTGAKATPEKDGCVAQLMKKAGYATAVAGKWRQLSHFKTKEDGAKWGFDEFLIWGAGGPEEGDGESKGGRYWDPDYNLNGEVLTDVKGKYGPDLLQDFVFDFMRRHKSEPFFIYYPMTLVHTPITTTPDTKALIDKTGKQPKDKIKGAVPGLDSLYADNIAYMDKQVGQIVAELDKLKLREKTLIVFTGDNGSVPVGTVNGRTIDGKKGDVNEGGSRVPLIVNWPGTTPAGVVRHDLLDFTDILPTFAALAGATLPEKRKIDGHSFAPQILGEKGQTREWVYVHLGMKRYVRSDRWKLTGKNELFDMRDAPFREILVEKDIGEEEAKAARAKLQAVLDGLHDDSTPPREQNEKGTKK
jgi:arylsulfatase A